MEIKREATEAKTRGKQEMKEKIMRRKQEQKKSRWEARKRDIVEENTERMLTVSEKTVKDQCYCCEDKPACTCVYLHARRTISCWCK